MRYQPPGQNCSTEYHQCCTGWRGWWGSRLERSKDVIRVELKRFLNKLTTHGGDGDGGGVGRGVTTATTGHGSRKDGECQEGVDDGSSETVEHCGDDCLESDEVELVVRLKKLGQPRPLFIP